jgi:D-glycero-D-manno-heptose 1,7-bisphosphate phosphatase
VDGVYVCPHRPEASCACRKPAPGLLLRAAAELGLDLDASLMIGDALSDVQAGLAAGARPALVLTGRGADQAPLLAAAGLSAVPIAADLAVALSVLAPIPPGTKTPPVDGGAGAATVGAILP